MATDDPPIDERSALTGIRILDFTRYQQGPFATMLLAPLMGLAIDTAQSQSIGSGAFWPIGIIGLLVGLAFFLTALRPTPLAAPVTDEVLTEPA